uniref:Uncharacterized protein n=1 Tax=Romanomermis culicivorax TaxID=13658 RepID=A0A915KFE6_ROMCU
MVGEIRGLKFETGNCQIEKLWSKLCKLDMKNLHTSSDLSAKSLFRVALLLETSEQIIFYFNYPAYWGYLKKQNTIINDQQLYIFMIIGMKKARDYMVME